MPQYRRRRLDLWRVERQVRENWARVAAVAIPVVVAVATAVMMMAR